MSVLFMFDLRDNKTGLPHIPSFRQIGSSGFVPLPPDPPEALALDEPAIRIAYLQGICAELLTSLKRYTTRRDYLAERIDEIRANWRERARESRSRLDELDNDIHGLFALAIERPKGKTSKQKIADAFLYAQELGLISNRTPLLDVPKKPTPEDRTPEPEANYDWIPASEVLQPPMSPAVQKDLKALYLKLAAIYHPDKWQGDPIRSQIMVEINTAYDKGDLIALLDIEKNGHRRISPSLRQTDEMFDRMNTLLDRVTQMERTVAMLQDQPEIRYAQSKSWSGNDSIDDEIAVTEAHAVHMSHLKEVLTAFCAKRTPIKAFLDILNLEREFWVGFGD